MPDADHATSTEPHKMNYVKQVIIFCVLIVIIPSILIIVPIYLWAGVFNGAVYPVVESEIIEIRDGISSIFCEQHTLEMSANFNAFQLPDKPEISTNREHVRLKKSITLPHNTVKYFGFYLLKGAEVVITLCSRYDGSQIVILRGERELETCGLLDYNKNKGDSNLFEYNKKIVNRSAATPYEDELDNHAGDDNADDETITPTTHSLPRFRRHHQEPQQTRQEADYKKKKQQVYDQLYMHRRPKRDNAVNYTENESTSTSSFEKSFFDCYKENIVTSHPLTSSKTCNSTHLIKTGSYASTRDKYIVDGYFYYIFYSDNELVQNDIHAIFDIYKPTFQYSNSTDTSKSCVNSTFCTFPISFLSNEIIVVEIPIRDGIQHGDNDITYLVSTCHPRMAVYAIFPISVLVLLLSYLFFCLVRLRSKERNPIPN